MQVRPGERIGLDGEIQTGLSHINQAAITGESLPVAKGPGESVYAGSLNGEGLLEVAVTAPASRSLLARIVITSYSIHYTKLYEILMDDVKKGS